MMYNIPEDKLPSEFKDEARLDSLFSPFRSKSVNPKDWDSKIASWKSIIALYCEHNGVFSFNVAFLNSLFTRHGRPPTCLNTVVEELIKSGELQYLEDFIKRPPKTWSGWASEVFIKKPIAWSFNTLRQSILPSKNNENQMLVHLKVIKTEAQKLLLKIPSTHYNKVISLTQVLKVLGSENVDVNRLQDMKLLIHYLANQSKADVSLLQNKDSPDNFLIKFMQDKFNPITEVDIGVYILEQNEKIFTKHVEDLEDEVAACIKEVKAHLLKGHRQLAKTCLKRKYEIEKRLDRKIGALHNVQTLLERIRDVHQDADVWQSYKHALSAFHTTFKETGLNEDAVEDTMLKLGEMLDMHEDIQSSLSKPVKDESTEDLEAELAELIKSEDSNETETAKIKDDISEQLSKLDLDSLPDVPSRNVSLKESSQLQ